MTLGRMSSKSFISNYRNIELPVLEPAVTRRIIEKINSRAFALGDETRKVTCFTARAEQVVQTGQ